MQAIYPTPAFSNTLLPQFFRFFYMRFRSKPALHHCLSFEYRHHPGVRDLPTKLLLHVRPFALASTSVPSNSAPPAQQIAANAQGRGTGTHLPPTPMTSGLNLWKALLRLGRPESLSSHLQQPRAALPCPFQNRPCPVLRIGTGVMAQARKYILI